MTDEYPLFTPPGSLAEAPPSAWSRAQAEQYFKWLLDNCDNRINSLLGYLKLNRRASTSRELIESVERCAIELLGGRPFTVLGQLTAQGYALAADIGLLIADRLLSDSRGRITWHLLKSPKSDRSYNLPVLVGFSRRLHLDPIAGAVGDAQWIARGNKKQHPWLETYNHWLTQASC